MFALRRGSSDSGNFGLRTTSATSATICGPNSVSTSPPMVVESPPTLTVSEPPMRAASSEICAAVRVAVPSRIRSPVRSASQTSLAFSKALPVRMLNVTRAFGIVPHCTSATSRPLSSVKRFGSGTLKSRGAPAFGGSAGKGAFGCFVAALSAAGFAVEGFCAAGLLVAGFCAAGFADGFSRGGCAGGA